MSRGDRKAAVETIRGSSKDSLVAIDDILQRFGGTRLAPAVDALGCGPVEATPSGIKALSTSPGIKAILEDQDITPLPKPKR